MTVKAGMRLGAYEILMPLGAGGMGEVYRARDTRLGRDVAVKVVSEQAMNDPNALARLEREARAIAALSHPNIVALHDFGCERGIAFAVMELLEGEPLDRYLAAGAVPWRKALSVATDGEVQWMHPPLDYRTRPRALRVFTRPEQQAPSA